MTFVKITEQPSSHGDLDKMSVRELLEGINDEDARVAPGRAADDPSAREARDGRRRADEARRPHFLSGGRNERPARRARRLGDTAHVRHASLVGRRTDRGRRPALRNPVEFAEDDEERGWEELRERSVSSLDTVIGIAASGTTPYVVGALRRAREHGVLTACITSNPGSPLAAEADIPIEMVVGPEFVTGSSRMKSGTGQKMICNMITTATMIRLGRVRGNRMVNMQLSNDKLIDRGTRMVADELGIGYERARGLLLLHGSASKAIEAGHDGKMPEREADV